jgi:hypothetical protein
MKEITKSEVGHAFFGRRKYDQNIAMSPIDQTHQTFPQIPTTLS